MSGATAGATELPDEIARDLRRARLLEWLTIGWFVVTVTMVIAVMGTSQAMKAAWFEDMLSFLPPIAFLVALRSVRKPLDDDYRWGHHRAIGAGHLAASFALLTMGGYLLVDSALTLAHREHPTIGTVHLFGHSFWQGWLMIAVLLVSAGPTVVLGRIKLRIAPRLHDKILFADADMNKADWQTAVGGCLGVVGIAVGWWWADAVVAIAIALSIVRDGVLNVRAATRGLLDRQARTHDDKELLGLVGQVEERARQLPWADDVWVRMRDLGHVMHTEVFVDASREVNLQELKEATNMLRALDWKLQDLVVVPMDELPDVGAGE